MKKKILITGGCGFIGVNTSYFFYKKKWKVFIIDNLSRIGAKKNKKWLLENTKNISIFKIDISNNNQINKIIKKIKPDSIIHLAGQTAVTTSIKNPILDFKSNIIGTFNLLESIRIYSPKTTFINASTNKVYGDLSDISFQENKVRYYSKKIKGINEQKNLSFSTPYGCSKGAADQYTIDYAKVFGLKTITLRQSCIYGNLQNGNEDQGWVSWFVKLAMNKKKINIFGNGKQVRDLLHINDLVNLYYLILLNKKIMDGTAYNVGGGFNNAISLLELINYLEKILKFKIKKRHLLPRQADQMLYISDNNKIYERLKWKPLTNFKNGILNMIEFNYLKN